MLSGACHILWSSLLSWCAPSRCPASCSSLLARSCGSWEDSPILSLAYPALLCWVELGFDPNRGSGGQEGIWGRSCKGQVQYRSAPFPGRGIWDWVCKVHLSTQEWSLLKEIRGGASEFLRIYPDVPIPILGSHFFLIKTLMLAWEIGLCWKPTSLTFSLLQFSLQAVRDEGYCINYKEFSSFALRCWSVSYFSLLNQFPSPSSFCSPIPSKHQTGCISFHLYCSPSLRVKTSVVSRPGAHSTPFPTGGYTPLYPVGEWSTQKSHPLHCSIRSYNILISTLRLDSLEAEPDVIFCLFVQVIIGTELSGEEVREAGVG